jgi:hypothetical protein
MRWAWHIGENKNAYKILVRKPEGKNHLDDLGIDGMILEWILDKSHGKV